MNNFYAKLAKAHEKNNSLLCIGLDPDPEYMPIPDIAEFNRLIIEATSDLACCYKPNLAFYEALGIEGLRALEKTLEFIPSFIPIIGDSKRGDVASTSRAYADAMFKQWGFDATTVNPYLGKDGIDPFIDYSDKGILILCRTSNPGASEFQDLEVTYQNRHIPLYERVALSAKEWNRNGNIGLVVGATYPNELSNIRNICEDMFILAPGVGSQGGDLESTVQLGIRKDGLGIAINASRSLLYASNNRSEFQMASRAVAAELRDRINEAREPLI